MRLNKFEICFCKNPTRVTRKEKEEKSQQILCDKKGLCFEKYMKIYEKIIL